MVASKYGFINIVKLLLERDAKINRSDKYRKTALVHAVVNGNLRIACLLL